MSSQPSQVTLLAKRLGAERFSALIERLDMTANPGDGLRVLGASEFFRYLVERQIDWLEHEADLSHNSLDAILACFNRIELLHHNETTVMEHLRWLRQRAMLHIVWRSFTQPHGLDEALDAMTSLADFVIHLAVRVAEGALVDRYGVPIGSETGTEQRLIVVGMGKLGGRELNLSSDIDIVFVYDEGGVTQGGRTSTSNQEFFTRVSQRVIRLIDSVTQDGRVFRVDTRLRPFGDSGALVASYQSLENYYQQHGRDWERYALLKSRCITGLPEQTKRFESLVKDFVYRRYTDFSIIDGLRDMKALIHSERVSKGLSDDVKRGPGGIREAEFVVQSQQLIRGGRIPSIQQVGFRESLEALCDQACLAPDMAAALLRHYRYLRQLEHGIQALRDEQTHVLPTQSFAQIGLCNLLRHKDWPELLESYGQSRDVISALFEDLLGDANEPVRLLVDLDSESPAIDQRALRALSLTSETAIAQTLEEFVMHTRFRAIHSEASQRLQKALPLIVKEVDRYAEPGETLTRVLAIVTAILKRSAYLSLLTENPQALTRTVDLVARSQRIAEKLCESPQLLDEFLFPDQRFVVPSKDEIRASLYSAAAHVDLHDLEAAMQQLRQFKDTIVFRVAASELEGSIPLMKVSDNLSFLAEVIIERSLNIAYHDLIEKYGEPEPDAEFCVLAYGKLGGIELSYESDLDLVFVFTGEAGMTAGPKRIEHHRFFTRLAQRMMHILSTNMMGGRLYEVDLRLRPNGDSGLLVTSLAAWAKYVKSNAWTWEHQALVRMRAVAGGAAIMRQVEDLRVTTLSEKREPTQLIDDVTAMRQRIREHKSDSQTLSKRAELKYARGGIVDIEFVVQYLVLANAHTHPQVCRWSDVIRLLGDLECEGLLSSSSAECLRDAYLGLRSLTHRMSMLYETEGDLQDATGLMERARFACLDVLPNL